MLHLLSTFVLVLILTGLSFRRNRRVHLPIMLTAFLIDLSLVLYIEITRHAVERVARHVSGMLYFHAGVSLATLLCYAGLLALGARLFNSDTASRSTHRNLGIVFVVLRLTNYVTSFAI